MTAQLNQAFSVELFSTLLKHLSTVGKVTHLHELFDTERQLASTIKCVLSENQADKLPKRQRALAAFARCVMSPLPTGNKAN